MYLDRDSDEFFPEQTELARMGFESIYWVCEILKECLQFEINAKYTDVGGESAPSDHAMGWTIGDPDDSAPNRPFNVRISLAADFMWPLLIEEYSAAEKAACSFELASTIVHELSVRR